MPFLFFIFKKVGIFYKELTPPTVLDILRITNSLQEMGSVAGSAAATAASAESSESETDNNDERTNKFLLLVDQVGARQ